MPMACIRSTRLLAPAAARARVGEGAFLEAPERARQGAWTDHESPPAS
jgi:hypothetical protein